MKHDVTIRAIVRVKVPGIEAPDQREAIREALRLADLEQALNRDWPTPHVEYVADAEEIDSYFVETHPDLDDTLTLYDNDEALTKFSFEEVVGSLVKVHMTDEEAERRQGSAPACEQCGKWTKGTYVLCTKCDKTLCDACDLRAGATDEVENEEPLCEACRKGQK